jgi:hypothetical protein
MFIPALTDKEGRSMDKDTDGAWSHIRVELNRASGWKFVKYLAPWPCSAQYSNSFGKQQGE